MLDVLCKACCVDCTETRRVLTVVGMDVFTVLEPDVFVVKESKRVLRAES
jgi:hypothetical protein